MQNINCIDSVQALPLLRLMQLVSPSLPIGAYAYSQGMESAVEFEWVNDETSTLAWLDGLLAHGICYTDLAILKRLYIAWQNQSVEEVVKWNQHIIALRETTELEAEDLHLGGALIRVLSSLQVNKIEQLASIESCSFLTAFSFAAVQWSIPRQICLMGFGYSWVENQIASAIKLIPLGQSAGQRILSELLNSIKHSVEKAEQLEDKDIGFSMPGYSIASAKHETQYSRLFRS